MPNSVKKFVMCLDSSLGSMWKDALDKSVVENHFAPSNSASIFSNVGIGNGIRCTYRFGPRRSMTSRISSFPFGTTNMEEQNYVSMPSVTGSMIFADTKLSSRFSTRGLTAIGILENTFLQGGFDMS